MDFSPNFPIVQAVRAMQTRRTLQAPPQATMLMQGMGALSVDSMAAERISSGSVGMALAWVAINGLCGYVVGKVLAPSDAKAGKYGLIGIPVGAFTGLLGMAVFAAVASSR